MANIDGTEGADSLVGTAEDDLITGLGGDDILDGGEGDNTLIAGDGNDVLVAGTGFNHLDGGAGNDFYHIWGTDFLLEDESGVDTAYVHVDGAIIPSFIENVIYDDGVVPIQDFLKPFLPENGASLSAMLGSNNEFFFSFPTLAPDYLANRPELLDGWSPLTLDQQTLVRDAFDYIESVVNLTFTETLDPETPNTLTFANTNQASETDPGIAYRPDLDPLGSDIFFNIGGSLDDPNNNPDASVELGYLLALALGTSPDPANVEGEEVTDPLALILGDPTGSGNFQDNLNDFPVDLLYSKLFEDYTGSLGKSKIYQAELALQTLFGTIHNSLTFNFVYVLTDNYDITDAYTTTPGFFLSMSRFSPVSATHPFESIISNVSDTFSAWNIGLDFFYLSGGVDFTWGRANLSSSDLPKNFTQPTFSGNVLISPDPLGNLAGTEHDDIVGGVYVAPDAYLSGLGGRDFVYGGSGDNHLFGDFPGSDFSGSNDVVHGGKGNDSIRGGPGNDELDGGFGIDIGYYRTSDWDDLLVTRLGNLSYKVEDTRTDSPLGTDTLKSIEKLALEDTFEEDILPAGSFYLMNPFRLGNTVELHETIDDMDGLSTKTFQWYADGIEILGATGTSLAITNDFIGEKISVTGTYTDFFGRVVKVNSFKSAPIPEFGGFASRDIKGGMQLFNNVQVQGDGRIVATGYSLIDTNHSAIATRLNFDGGADHSFGRKGVFRHRPEDGDSHSSGSSILPDGRVLLSGYISDTDGTDTNNILLGPNGRLDRTFGSEGVDRHLTMDYTDSSAGFIRNNDGGFTGVGTSINGSTDLVITRLQINGTLDPNAPGVGVDEPDSLNGPGGGIQRINLGFDSQSGVDLIEQADGKLVIAATVVDGGLADAALVRVNADGSLDVGFGNAGVVVLDFESPNEEAVSVVAQADGKLLLATLTVTDVDSFFALTNYNTDGSINTAFGTDGTVKINLPSDDNHAGEVFLQDDGKIIFTGSTYGAATSNFILGRWNADGTPDVTFGNNGLADAALLDDLFISTSGTVQQNGQIIVAGAMFADSQDGAVLRFDADGTLDDDFGNGQMITFETPGSVDIAGTATEGLWLAAQPEIDPRDNPSEEVDLQWLVNGQEVPGATGDIFFLTQSEVNAGVSVNATYIDNDGVERTVSSNPTPFVANTNDLPVGDVTINGEAAQGQTLTAVANLTDADGIGTLAYQWQGDGTPIAGATDENFLLTPDEVDKVITVVVSYTDDFGAPESVTSAGTDAVVAVVGLLVEGDSNDNLLVGENGDDTIRGLEGNDTLVGGGGDDQMEGDEGIDLARYAANDLLDFTVVRNGNELTVNGPESEGSDSLIDVERLEFQNANVAYDLEGNAGIAVKALGALLGAEDWENPDFIGIALDLLDNLGFTHLQIMQLGIEFLLGANPANSDVVSLIYTNLVGSPPSQSELNFYTAQLDQGIFTPGTLGVAASEHEINLANIGYDELVVNGVLFEPVV